MHVETHSGYVTEHSSAETIELRFSEMTRAEGGTCWCCHPRRLVTPSFLLPANAHAIPVILTLSPHGCKVGSATLKPHRREGPVPVCLLEGSTMSPRSRCACFFCLHLTGQAASHDISGQEGGGKARVLFLAVLWLRKSKERALRMAVGLAKPRGFATAGNKQ